MKGKVGGQWNKIFMEIFRSMLHGVCPFSLVSLTELCSLFGPNRAIEMACFDAKVQYARNTC